MSCYIPCFINLVRMFCKKCIDIRDYIILKLCSRDIDIRLGIETICIRRRSITSGRIIIALTDITQAVYVGCIRRSIRVLTIAHIRLRRRRSRFRFNRLRRTTIYLRKLDTFHIFQIANQNDCYLSTSCCSTGA